MNEMIMILIDYLIRTYLPTFRLRFTSCFTSRRLDLSSLSLSLPRTPSDRRYESNLSHQVHTNWAGILASTSGEQIDTGKAYHGHLRGTFSSPSRHIGERER